MEGVTILNQYEVVLEKAFSWPTFWLIVGIAAVASAAISFLTCLSEGDMSWELILVVTIFATVILGGIVGTLVGYDRGDPIKTTTEYQVIITDDVSMSDFMNKYEIIEQEGLIYTVREKSNDG